MRVVIVKNVGQIVKAVSQWDGVSHMNVPKNHTMIQSDDPKVVEGVQVDIAKLQAVAQDTATQRIADQKAADAASHINKVKAARALIAAEDAGKASV